MTTAKVSLGQGQFKLVIAIAAFTVALVFLLVFAGIGNATQTPEARTPVSVSTGIVSVQQGFKTPVNIFGLIESPKATSVSFDIAGQVFEVGVEEGDWVSAGDVLARQDTKRLMARKQELSAALARAQADLNLASVSRDRTVDLVSKKLESIQRLDEVNANVKVATARVQETEAAINSLLVEIEKATLFAPFDGMVNARFIDEGSVVAAGTPVLGMTSLDNYQARFAVPADVISQFALNTTVTVNVGESTVTGVIKQQLPQRNRQTRTVDILVTLNGNEGVRPGDMAILNVSRSHSETGAWLPVSALSNGLRGLWRVFVLSDGQPLKLQARVVEVVYTDGNQAFVRGALKEGEMYVNEGTHKLAPGQIVSLPSQRQMGAH